MTEPRRPKNQKGPARSYMVTQGSASDFFGVDSGTLSTTTSGGNLDLRSFVDEADESDLGMAIRRFGKKDITTKLRALSDLIAGIPEAPVETLKVNVQALVHAYDRYWYHPHRHVRENLQRVITLLLQSPHKEVKNELAKFMGTLVTPWWACMEDVDPMVRSLAGEMWCVAFSDATKQQAVRQRYAVQFFQGADLAVSLCTVASLKKEEGLSTEEAEDAHDAMLHAVLRAAGRLMTDVFTTCPQIQPVANKFLEMDALWNSKGVQARGALLACVSIGVETGVVVVASSPLLPKYSSILNDAVGAVQKDVNHLWAEDLVFATATVINKIDPTLQIHQSVVKNLVNIVRATCLSQERGSRTLFLEVLTTLRTKSNLTPSAHQLLCSKCLVGLWEGIRKTAIADATTLRTLYASFVSVFQMILDVSAAEEEALVCTQIHLAYLVHDYVFSGSMRVVPQDLLESMWALCSGKSHLHPELDIVRGNTFTILSSPALPQFIEFPAKFPYEKIAVATPEKVYQQAVAFGSIVLRNTQPTTRHEVIEELSTLVTTVMRRSKEWFVATPLDGNSRRLRFDFEVLNGLLGILVKSSDGVQARNVLSVTAAQLLSSEGPAMFEAPSSPALAQLQQHRAGFILSLACTSNAGREYSLKMLPSLSVALRLRVLSAVLRQDLTSSPSPSVITSLDNCITALLGEDQHLPDDGEEDEESEDEEEEEDNAEVDTELLQPLKECVVLCFSHHPKLLQRYVTSCALRCSAWGDIFKDITFSNFSGDELVTIQKCVTAAVMGPYRKVTANDVAYALTTTPPLLKQDIIFTTLTERVKADLHEMFLLGGTNTESTHVYLPPVKVFPKHITELFVILNRICGGIIGNEQWSSDNQSIGTFFVNLLPYRSHLPNLRGTVDQIHDKLLKTPFGVAALKGLLNSDGPLNSQLKVVVGNDLQVWNHAELFQLYWDLYWGNPKQNTTLVPIIVKGKASAPSLTSSFVSFLKSPNPLQDLVVTGTACYVLANSPSEISAPLTSIIQGLVPVVMSATPAVAFPQGDAEPFLLLTSALVSLTEAKPLGTYLFDIVVQTSKLMYLSSVGLLQQQSATASSPDSRRRKYSTIHAILTALEVLVQKSPSTLQISESRKELCAVLLCDIAIECMVRIAEVIERKEPWFEHQNDHLFPQCLKRALFLIRSVGALTSASAAVAHRDRILQQTVFSLLLRCAQMKVRKGNADLGTAPSIPTHNALEDGMLFFGSLLFQAPGPAVDIADDVDVEVETLFLPAHLTLLTGALTLTGGVKYAYDEGGDALAHDPVLHTATISYFVGWATAVRWFSETASRAVKSDFDKLLRYGECDGKIMECILSATAQSRDTVLTSPVPPPLNMMKTFFASLTDPNEVPLSQRAVCLLGYILETTPATLRTWYHDAPNYISEKVARFTSRHISPNVVKNALATVREKASSLTAGLDSSDADVKVSSASVVVSFDRDGNKVQLKLTFPDAYPLEPIQVSVADIEQQRMMAGVAREVLRKWLLKVSTELVSGNATMCDVIELWLKNLKKHFDGIEPCPICYSVVHPDNMRLPELKCGVCTNVVFHHKCLHDWFRKSGINTCPTCRTPWNQWKADN